MYTLPNDQARPVGSTFTPVPESFRYQQAHHLPTCLWYEAGILIILSSSDPLPFLTLVMKRFLAVLQQIFSFFQILSREAIIRRYLFGQIFFFKIEYDLDVLKMKSQNRLTKISIRNYV